MNTNNKYKIEIGIKQCGVRKVARIVFHSVAI